ncbi:type I phosphatidylinositol 4,5-bisphosphate 4-phosphatase-A-like isoform X2 [Stegodyphus dumicola]|uniref:type I phosphatidylinositol 4,5-bisphosphate 4-phosphatase-A-like isoform X2 n=1 Tax=Stegodyphus dumicola TaxID=202533 RepID=UPI0015AA025B|nr:type I phosphatidylinositol 4,5-bisphosphate 4-phosphatase-A-like isoform X2 [Stegodyphus dumicola]
MTEVKRAQVFPYTSEDIPTILKRTPGHSYDGVKCMTCKYYINVHGKEKKIIIMCPACNEATPIRKPPGDKMFVRCVCNCLLVCKTSARTIMCPRPNCATLIDIAQKTGRSAAISNPANIVFISCAFCHHIFQVSSQKRICSTANNTSFYISSMFSSGWYYNSSSNIWDCYKLSRNYSSICRFISSFYYTFLGSSIF